MREEWDKRMMDEIKRKEEEKNRREEAKLKRKEKVKVRNDEFEDWEDEFEEGVNFEENKGLNPVVLVVGGILIAATVYSKLTGGSETKAKPINLDDFEDETSPNAADKKDQKEKNKKGAKAVNTKKTNWWNQQTVVGLLY